MSTQASTGTGRGTAPLLTVTGLGKSYRRRPVLRDVSLQAHPGQVVAVTGENGSGKTTLLRICAGLETADTGTVRRCAAIGYCPQEPALFDLLTPAGHLALFASDRHATGTLTAVEAAFATADSWPRLCLALSNQSELAERAPSSRSQEMTFSCLVPSPLAASRGVPCA